MKIEVARIGFVRVALAAAISAAIQPVLAADDGPQVKEGLEEMVVTARYREEKLQSTPLAITAITADDLAIRGITSSYEIGYTVPNASLRPAQAAFGSTMTAYIRGIGQYDFDFAFEPGVGIYVDDVYHPFTLASQVDLLDLERVEVLRGPQGTLFGRGSIGGTIRYVSKKPTGENAGSIEVAVGEYDRVDLRASYDMALADNVFARFSGVSKKRDGYQDVIDFACRYPDLAGGLKPLSNNRGKGCKIGTQGGQDVQGARAAIRWVASDDLEFNFTGEYMDDSSEARADTLTAVDSNTVWDLRFLGAMMPTTYDDKFIPKNIYQSYATYSDPLNGIQVKPETTLEKTNVTGRMDWQIQENFGSSLILAYTEINTTLATDADASPLNIQTVDGVQDIDFWTAELRFHGRAMDRLDWTVGGFLYKGNAVNDQMVSIPFLSLVLDGHLPTEGGDPFVVAHNDHDVDSKSVFMHGVFDVTDKMKLTAGVRYTDDQKNVTFDNKRVQNPNVVVEDTHTDWMVSASYQWIDEFMTYATVATGYRPGSYNPRPFQATQVVAVDQEESTSYELGFKSDLFENRVRLNVAAFYTDWDTRILPVGGTECILLDLGPPPVYLLDPTGTPDSLGNVCGPKVSRTFYENGPAKIKGFEVEANWRVVDSLTLSAAYGYTKWDSNDINDNPNVEVGRPAYVPKENWTVGLQHILELGSGASITSRVDVYGQSEICSQTVLSTSLFPGAGCTESYELVNARVQWSNPDDSWQIAFGLQNATDEEYFLNKFDLTAFGQPHAEGQPGVPREWYVSAKRNF